MTTNSSPPSRAASAPSGIDRESTSATSRSKRVSELVARAVVDLLEVVAVDDEQAQRYAPVLRRGELAFEPLLEAAPVQDPRQGVRDGAESLALQREGGVERGGDVSREHGGRVEQVWIDVRRLRAQPHHRAQLAGVRAQRKPDDRGSSLQLQHLEDHARVRLRSS